MTPKSSSLDDTRSTLRELFDRGEEVINVFVEELTGSSTLREELEKTLRRANLARKTVDRNMEAVLGALNLPTRRDYTRLVEEIHSLQGSIVNLNMKMDRLLAAAAAAATPKPLAMVADGHGADRAVRPNAPPITAPPKRVTKTARAKRATDVAHPKPIKAVAHPKPRPAATRRPAKAPKRAPTKTASRP